ncbi:unnamed protein product [Coffea canephora]|uniref:Uncharacterized protein n=1 Tax=Coffea canephora TaxID=49390 RepID=A0A068U2J6_COFCA|nr:unnamed protein product [Coffea canephora]
MKIATLRGNTEIFLLNALEFNGFQKETIQLVKPAKGTTTLAFMFRNGWGWGAKKRGNMKPPQSVGKIIEINPYMVDTMAGGDADCQFWHRNLGIKPANRRTISVAGALKLLVSCIPAMARDLIGCSLQGPGLYYADSECGWLTGTVVSVGSGSPCAYGVLDGGYRFDICLLKQQLGWPDPPFTMPHSEMAPVVMVSVVCLYLRSIFLLLSGEAMMLENFTAHIILSSKR